MSDPSDELCRVYDPKTEQRPSPVFDLQFATDMPWISPEPKIKYGKDAIYTSSLFDDYIALAELKDQFEGRSFQRARDLANPYEEISNSIFSNRAAIKFANTDAVFGLTENVKLFADIAAGPGAFTQYIQWRKQESFGYGMTLKGKLDWNKKIIDQDRFSAEYGKGGKGDLYQEAPDFITLLRSKGGMDLITGDGGFDLGDDKEKMRKQEFVSSRLFLSQILVGIGGTKSGGHFVVKTFDTLTLLSFQLTYLLTQCFEKVSIFKPISSRPANAERYIVCMNRVDTVNSQAAYDLILKTCLSYGEKMVASMFANTLPEEFVEWMERQNQISLDRQLSTTKLILEYMNADTRYVNVAKTRFIHKVYALWAIPGPQLIKGRK